MARMPELRGFAAQHGMPILQHRGSRRVPRARAADRRGCAKPVAADARAANSRSWSTATTSNDRIRRAGQGRGPAREPRAGARCTRSASPVTCSAASAATAASSSRAAMEMIDGGRPRRASSTCSTEGRGIGLAQQDPRLRAAGPGARHGRGQSRARLRRRHARLRRRRADPVRLGVRADAADDQQSATRSGARGVRPRGRRARADRGRAARLPTNTTCATKRDKFGHLLSLAGSDEEKR